MRLIITKSNILQWVLEFSRYKSKLAIIGQIRQLFADNYRPTLPYII